MNVLTALKALYEDLAERGALPSFGWSPIKICCVLDLTQTGALAGVTHTTKAVTTARSKTFVEPEIFRLPAAVARGTSFYPNFLWDNAAFALGLDINGNAYRAQRSFQAFHAFHHQLLDGVDTPASMALLRFLDAWTPEAAQCSIPAEVMEDLALGRNLTFSVQGCPLAGDPAIRDAWDRYYGTADGPEGQCLITGERTTTVLTHPFIRKLDGAQPSGAKLVSFKAAAFCSHDHTQGENAPVSKYGAFAYTAALNYLLDERKFIQTAAVGSTTVVFWAVGADPAREDSLYEATRALLNGELPNELEDELLDTELYLLGLDPNAARISVRFFFRRSLRELISHAAAHHRRMALTKPPFEPLERVPLRQLFDDLVPPRRELPSPTKVAALLAVLTGEAYPRTLPQAALTRVRTDGGVTRVRAAILKAYYLQNPDPRCPEELLTVSLNGSSGHVPYLLGRLFAVMEAIQETAAPTGGPTFRRRSLSAAFTAPAAVFPGLTAQSAAQLRRLEAQAHGLHRYLVTQAEELLGRLPGTLPAVLDMAEQSAFCLGYYHQTQERYTRKEVK